jgi:hypothetical protein
MSRKEIDMDRQTVSRIVVALLVIVGIFGVGAYEYRLGVAHGMATSGKLPAGAPGAYPYPFWGFHPFGFVFPLLFFFLVFGLGRRFLWGGWGRPHGWRGEGSSSELEKWHHEAHERMSRQGS